MPSIIIDERDVRFVLNEQLKVEDLCKLPLYQEYSPDMFEMVLNEGHKMAEKMFECNVDGDKEGAKWEAGKVTLPASYYDTYKTFCEGGWVSPSEPVEDGGQGLPLAVGAALSEMFAAANFALLCLPNLTHGSGRLIQFFGTEEQKRTYMDRMYTGEWSGTMCLTEPGAGSDVGNIKTKAVENPDGTYSITGNKIFITYGEQDATENIVHAVLARIEGDPPGTKGISIFIVPKMKVNPDGSVGESNDVYCAGIEEKMGMHGSPTCQLNFGENGNCTGYLLGERCKGMKIMFYMMNEARFYVGLQGQGLTSTSYLHALRYAKERLQGSHLTEMKNAAAPRVPIIEHPDIRRTLMNMKAYTEGGRAIIYFTGYCMDMARSAETEEEKEKYSTWEDLLIPICKGYVTDRSMEMTSESVQVHGGYGYCAEYPVEQFMRDCKIASIYEGTNGIQAIDLIGRKLGLNKGGVFMDFLKNMDEAIETAAAKAEWKKYADKLAETREKVAKLPAFFLEQSQSAEFALPFINATQFLQVFGDLCVGWMLLWQANIAGEKLEAIYQAAGAADDEAKLKLVKDNIEAAYYAGKLAVAKHFIGNVLPVSQGRIDAIYSKEGVAWDVPEEVFGG